MTDGATTTDLNTVIEPGSGDGITLFSAFDVNNKGQIVGNAMNEAGQVLGFLLTPIGAMEAEGVGLQAPDRRGPRVTDVTAVREFLSNDPRVKAGL
jgi:probable HAF family extracellular repeat protein